MIGLIRAEWDKLLRAQKVWVVLLAAVALNLAVMAADALLVDPVEPAGYRKAGAAFQECDFAQAKENIQAASDRAKALRQWKECRTFGIFPSGTQTAHSLYESCAEDVQAGRQPLYASDLRREQIVLFRMRGELNVMEEYHAFCGNLDENAARLSALAGSAGAEGYPQRVLTQQAEAYRPFQKAKPIWQPEYGVRKAIQFSWTDGLALLLVLFVTVQGLCAERDHSMNGLLCTVPHGWNVALAKVLALAGAQLGLLLLLYGGNLLLCGLLYGMPRLDLPIQSLAFAAYSPLRCTVGEYLVFFVGLKWLAGLALTAVSLLLLLLAQSKLMGTGLVLFHVLADFALYRFLPDGSRWSLAKHLNCLALWETEPRMDRFTQLPVGEWPVPGLLLGLLAGVGMFLLGTLLFLWLFPVGMRARFPRHNFALHCRRTQVRHVRGLFGAECRKILCGQKVLWILAAYLLLQGYCAFSAPADLMPEQSAYKNAMQGLTGWYDQDSYQQLLDQRDQVLPVWETYRLYAAGQIDFEQFDQFRLMNEDLFRKYEAYQQIRGKNLFYVKRHPGTALVYEPGYEYFLDVDDHKDAPQTILAALVLLLCFADAGEYERRTSMQLLLQTTPGGWKQVVRAKYKTVFWVAAIVGLGSLLPQFVYAVKAFGLPGLHLPAASLPGFAWMPLWVPLWLLVLGKAALHMAGCGMLVAWILAFALKVGQQSIVWAVGCGIFVLLPLLGFLLPGPLHFWGLYAAFHLLTAWGSAIPALWCGLFGCSLAVCAWAGYEWTAEDL